jgi:hypothetical protein
MDSLKGLTWPLIAQSLGGIPVLAALLLPLLAWPF